MRALIRNSGLLLVLLGCMLLIPSHARAACAMHYATVSALFDKGTAQQVARDTLSQSIANWAGGVARVGRVRVSCRIDTFGFYQCEARAKAYR